jgi:hypothetical protein
MGDHMMKVNYQYKGWYEDTAQIDVINHLMKALVTLPEVRGLLQIEQEKVLANTNHHQHIEAILA